MIWLFVGGGTLVGFYEKRDDEMKDFYLEKAGEAFRKGDMTAYYYYVWLAGKEKED